MAKSAAQRQAKWRRQHPAKARVVSREAQQKRRDAAKEARPAGIDYPDTQPDNEAEALIEWAEKVLIVPHGHSLAGQPFKIPDYGARFIRDCLASKCKDGLICMARKQGKTAITAVIVLYFLVGPGRRRGWRCGIASTSRLTAGELRGQIEAIATASNLKGIRFWKRSSPAITTDGGSVDVLSADRNSGAASGYDLVIVDELGLLQEKDRGLINSLRASLAAKNGRFLALSIFGSGPHVPEFLARKDHEGVCVHLYQPPLDSKIGDESAWRAGNPGLGSIKSLAHMRAALKRVLSSVGDQSFFRAEEMNLPGESSKELLCSPDDWKKCVVRHSSELPPRGGRAWLALDPGGSASMTSCACAWENGRLECFSAFPAVPSLEDRGTAEGLGSLYVQARARGELKTYSGRVTNVADFLASVIHELADVEIVSGASDRFRKSEVLQILEDPKTGAEFPWEFVPMGCGERGSADVRALQRSILRAEFKTLPSLLFASGLSSAIIRRDGNSNPGLERSGKARIDLVSALVLAAGLRAAAGDDSEFSVCQRSVT